MTTMQSHRWEHYSPGERRSGCDEWCAPLHLIEARVRGQPWAELFDVDDFQIGPRLIRPNHPNLHLYKHGFTRVYLNVDTNGRTYKYVPPTGSVIGAGGRYVGHRRLQDAIDALCLWEIEGPRPGSLRVVRPSAPDLGSAARGGVGPAA